MKLNLGLDREFKTNLDVMKTSNFQMKASPQAFRILSDSLYKNPHLAVVRELAANAWDSHVMNGNPDVPFEVHAPTDLEPYFEVNDFGTSMSDEFVHSNYITFFESDKDHSDEAIGGYGLGSKAPFAYADQFTLRCRLGGLERSYQLLINAGSEYQLMDRGSPTPTAEPDGVRITIPVADKDFEAFQTAVRDVVRFFPTVPVCNIELDIEAVGTEIVVDDEVTLKYLANTEADERCVVMGFVKYDYDTYKMNNMLDWEQRSIFHNCRIHVPINYFDITPDREGIRFSDRTVERFKKLVVKADSVLEDEMSVLYSKLATNYERMEFIINQMGRYGGKAIRKEQAPVLEEAMKLPYGCQWIKIEKARRSMHLNTERLARDYPFSQIMSLRSRRKVTDQPLYQMDRKRPFLHHFKTMNYNNEFPQFIALGPASELNQWALDNGLPPFVIVPKAKVVRAPKGAKPKITHQSYKNIQVTPNGVLRGLHEGTPADEMFDAFDKVIIAQSIEEVEEIANTVKLFTPLMKPMDFAAMYVPEHHNRVTERLTEDFGATVYRSNHWLVDYLKNSFGVDKDSVAMHWIVLQMYQDVSKFREQICCRGGRYWSHEFNSKTEQLLAREKMQAKYPMLGKLFNDTEAFFREFDGFSKTVNDNRIVTFLGTLDIKCKGLHTKYEKRFEALNKLKLRAVTKHGDWVHNMGPVLHDFTEMLNDSEDGMESFVDFFLQL